MIEEYPLKWPSGRARATSRKKGTFQRTYAQSKAIAYGEMEALGVKDAILSSDKATAKSPNPADPAVVLWFTYKGELRSIAIDTYREVDHNAAAIAMTVEALRKIERHGGLSIFEQAIRGFADALPARGEATVIPPREDWFRVLGVAEDAPMEVVEAVYRTLSRSAHPDTPGGSHEKMARLNEAIAAARAARGGSK